MNISLIPEDSLIRMKNIAGELLNASIVSVQRIGGGSNSQVYRLVDERGKEFAAKIYFHHPRDPRDRLGVEFSAVTFLYQQGFLCVPRPVVMSAAERIGIYGFVDGNKISLEEVKESDVDYLIWFLAELKNIREKAGGGIFSAASEASFSLKGVVDNIQSRIDRLMVVEGETQEYEALRRYLQQKFIPFFEILVEWGRKKMTQTGWNFDGDIPLAERTVSPSDYGFHNALRDKQGQIIFLDFEYFGWDDPAKMISDFLLHPAMNVNHHLKKRFVRNMMKIFGEFQLLASRLNILFPFFGLKWGLIFPNEFVPDDFMRRGFASVEEIPKERRHAEQLLKSQKMLRFIQANYQNFPYEYESIHNE